MAIACAHCGARLADREATFCCTGCETVASLIRDAGLERYYTLGGRTGVPVEAPAGKRDHLWLASTVESFARVGHATLDIQGMRCAACVWLLEETFRRRTGGKRIVVDPGLGRIELWAEPGFDLLGYVVEVERFGYALGPADKTPDLEGQSLMVRAGIAAAVAMNVMTFAFAEYLGLTEGSLRATFQLATVVLAAIGVAVAAPPFLRGAFEAIRRGVLSLDVPIALGIVLSSSACAVSYFVAGEPHFADTVSVFAALMLIGRVIERRSLARARRQLLANGEMPALFVRRIEDGMVKVVPATEIAEGDVLLVAPGEVVPVDAALVGDPVELSLDWISGESQPQTRSSGEIVPAGAFVRGQIAARLTARTDLSSSPILSLVRRPPPPSDAHGPQFWDRVARWWAGLVLLTATSTAIVWLALGDVEGAVLATTAVLVVTCPCGIGIANPLAHELARAVLRRSGVFVRTARALDRAAEVDAIVFDKTGTLTTGALRLADVLRRDEANDADLAVAVAMASTSTHPRADALFRALSDTVPARADLTVREVPGDGLEAELEGARYRLGRPGFAAPGHALSSDALVLSRDGSPRLVFAFDEELRSDAAREVAALGSAGGHGPARPIFVLSGDTPERAVALGTSMGIPTERCIGGARPEDKAQWLKASAPPRALFVGDGLNDALAAESAFLSGTPAIDRPFLPARTDFHFLSVESAEGTSGLSAIRTLLRVAALLRRVTRRNLAFALAYNVFAVAWASSGLMHPWIAAVLMPLSSLVVITHAALAFSLGRAPAAPASCPVPRERPRLSDVSAAPLTARPLPPEPLWKS